MDVSTYTRCGEHADCVIEESNGQLTHRPSAARRGVRPPPPALSRLSVAEANRMSDALDAMLADMAALALRVDALRDERLQEARTEAGRVLADVPLNLRELGERVGKLDLSLASGLRALADRLERIEASPTASRAEVEGLHASVRRDVAALADVVRRLPTDDSLRPLFDRVHALEITTTSLATTVPRELEQMNSLLRRRVAEMERELLEVHRKLDG